MVSNISHGGVMTQIRRDAMRRETARIDGRSNVSRTVYDAQGRQVEAHDAAGVTTFAYDAYGANTNETVIGVVGTNVLERLTDAYGRNAGYAINGARQTILGYDEHTGRLATMQVPTTEEEEQNHCPPPPAPLLSAFHWTYYPGSDLKSQLAYPNGLTASWTYDANSQLLQVRNATPTNVISQYDYAYDAAGRRIACARSGVAMSVIDTIAYAYNVRGELTNALSNVDANYAYSYQYDYIGNRVSSEECGVRSAEYVANELNQYTQIDTSTSESSCEAFNPEFDDDGNQTLIHTATGTWRVTYNGENRPVLWTCLAACDTIATNGETIAMSYDRMGRRVAKNDERFVYDGYLCIKKLDDSTPLHTSPLPIHCYVWDPTERTATRPLVRNASAFQFFNSSTYYYAHDGNKNVVDVVASDGTISAHYEYAPFGVLTVSLCETNVESNWRFSSEYTDDLIGCDYYIYREYNSMAGRWIQRDKIQSDDGNIYQFCANDACGAYDYLGLLFTVIEHAPGEAPRMDGLMMIMVRLLLQHLVRH